MPKEHSYYTLSQPPSSEVTGLVDCTQLFNVGVGVELRPSCSGATRFTM